MHDYDYPDYACWYLDDNWDDDDGVNAASQPPSNSAKPMSGLSGEDSTMSVGKQFHTSNSTVRELAEGTMLQVVGQGQLEIVEVPTLKAEDLDAGDRVTSRYGPATVVRPSSRIHVGLEEGEVLYIADGTDVVRRAFASELA